MDNIGFVLDENLPVVGDATAGHHVRCGAPGAGGRCSEGCLAGTIVPVYGL